LGRYAVGRNSEDDLDGCKSDGEHGYEVDAWKEQLGSSTDNQAGMWLKRNVRRWRTRWSEWKKTHESRCVARGCVQEMFLAWMVLCAGA
jgi:hypothetical protein